MLEHALHSPEAAARDHRDLGTRALGWIERGGGDRARFLGTRPSRQESNDASEQHRPEKHGNGEPAGTEMGTVSHEELRFDIERDYAANVGRRPSRDSERDDRRPTAGIADGIVAAPAAWPDASIVDRDHDVGRLDDGGGGLPDFKVE